MEEKTSKSLKNYIKSSKLSFCYYEILLVFAVTGLKRKEKKPRFSKQRMYNKPIHQSKIASWLYYCSYTLYTGSQ